MEEKTYKLMGNTGAINITFGVVSIIAGVAAGVILIVSGAKLLSEDFILSNRVEPWSQRPWDKNPWDKDTGQTYHAHKNKKKKKKHFRLRTLIFKRRYIFTDNVHPRKGILSFILGIIAAVALFLCVKAAFDAGGQADIKYGVAVFLAFGYSISGFVLGILAMKQKKIFKIFPCLGIILNALNIMTVVFLTIMGSI